MEGDFRLGEWLICPQLNTVQNGGKTVRLEHKFMQVLVCLAERPGDVVSKEELIRRVWADSFVTDDVLTRAVSELRRILSDDAKRPHIIETVSKNGYRLIAPVQHTQDSSSAAGREVQANFFAGRRRKVLAAMAVALVAIAITVAFALLRKPTKLSTSGPQPIAVLPLQNASAAKELDFLRLGLADDIATTLSFYPSLSIRPFAATSKYAGPDIDLQKTARELRVADLITGHFLVAGENVEVTLEAVDAADNRVLWRVTLRGATRDLTWSAGANSCPRPARIIPALGVNTGPMLPRTHPTMGKRTNSICGRCRTTMPQIRRALPSLRKTRPQSNFCNVPWLSIPATLQPGRRWAIFITTRTRGPAPRRHFNGQWLSTRDASRRQAI